jgi:hypothetical protein
MNKDQADKFLPIENDFVCKNNPPSWYGCRKCDYYYNIDGSRCIKREIKEWALYHATRTESEEKE